MEPIAIVGRACVLPGALSPEALWQALIEQRDLIRSVRELPGQRWGLDPDTVLGAPGPDRCYSDRGGFVEGFEAIFDSGGFALPADEIARLDPLVHWLLHCSRQALNEVRSTLGARIGAVVGNLGFPSESMAAYAADVWTHGRSARPAASRHMSGGSADALAAALGLSAGCYCLDAACASSLYAIKLACDRLADGDADVMLAGAVQRADPLFLQQGFAALGALSPSGQSRPFHRDADGLLPAEGCAILALKRYRDARADGDTIHAVIRGIGLGNDGRGKGLLAPDPAGQLRAMRAAYLSAGLDPTDVSLLECHATGTSLGDAAELASSAQIFAAHPGLPIGSLKSNLGHPMTVAGAAGIVKLIEALRHATRPPNRPVDAPTTALAATPFRLLQAPEPWPAGSARIAAISAFGFGGNNAHLLLSDDVGIVLRDPLAPPSERMAVVGLGLHAGAARDRFQVAQAVFGGEQLRRMAELELDLTGLRFPPNDLKQALPQQLLILAAARAALDGLRLPQRSAVIVGMEPDAEVARYGLRWRLAEARAAPDWQQAARDAVVTPLTAAGVLGCMPNIPANRLSSELDCIGPAFTVQAGAESGWQALAIGARALRTGDADAAIVGAVDLGCEPVNSAAGHSDPGDAAVVLVLKRAADAERDGDPVLAWLEPAAGPMADDLAARASAAFGDTGAAAGLMQTALAALQVLHRRRLDGTPWLSATPRRLAIGAHALSQAAAGPCAASPRLHIYGGADRAAVIAALAADRPSDGPARAVLVAHDGELPALRQHALAHLRDGAPPGSRVHFREQPIGGEIAFAFAGAGASYPGMGKALLEGFPGLLDALSARSLRLATALDWSLDHHPSPSAVQQLWGASALSQLHLALSEAIGLRADAWLGYSSGETNALVAAGVWRDPDALLDEMDLSELMTRELGGEFAAVAAQWHCPVRWASATVIAPLAEVNAAIADLDRLHLAIIYADHNCLIAGDAEQCERAVARLGAARCVMLDYPLAVHVPELLAVRERWYRLHWRETFAPRHGRIYGSASGLAYAPSREACAQAILDQAERTLDLRPVVLQAWNDGVRVFVEHGPGTSFARAIREILGAREALVVSLDRKGQGRDAVLHGAAALIAAGVAIDLDALQSMLHVAQPMAQRQLRLPAHRPAIEWPVERMAPAPALPDPAAPSELREAPPAPTKTPVRAAPEIGPLALAQGEQRIPTGSGFGATARSPAGAALWHQALAALAEQQQQHVALRTAAHQQFLAHRARALDLLLTVRDGRSPALNPPGPAAHRDAPVVATDLPAPPRFDRSALEIHASGRIADIFGPAFAAQADFARQVRMPSPPLLLADRVVALDGIAGSMGKGQIVTETDIDNHAWALLAGRLPAGLLIEAGQADLMLISWLGVDALNRGERVYRLLGCELTYHGDLPAAGDTLRFDIHLDGHAAQGDVRLMFFHYDCVNGERAQLSVREGQAGFFSDAELAASTGCLWSPETQTIVAEPRLDPPVVRCSRRRLERHHLEALANGDAATCFGPGFEFARTHSRTPSIHSGRMLLLDRIVELDADGGPWRRGYLRAELDIDPGQWFFAGHFKNDPCMPGTLMFEACLQAMAIVLSAGGHTLRRDGWRFQPVPELPYRLQCRGQVTPASRQLVTEVFVEELIAGPVPTVYADLLCSVDGLKAFHARRVALQLVPDWPLGDVDSDPADASAPVADGFRFDRRSLLACALGRPSAAFGPMYRRFDGGQRVARLPSPPYHFITRIAAIEGPIGAMRKGARVIAEYDIPDAAWYFDAHRGTMPFAVLLEAALQPCGWLSSYVGSALTTESELGFRNLDGDGEVLIELRPGDGTLVTEVDLVDVSASAGMIIETFSVRCHVQQREVYRLRTVFGFFPPEALAAQAGLPIDANARELFERAPTGEVYPSSERLPSGRLRMFDRIEGWWPTAGAAGLGQVRASKQVSPDDWFFKAHFFQDPVQPGSLGLEAMLQVLTWTLLQDPQVASQASTQIESIASARPHRWRYRGQVLPQHRCMHIVLDITERGADALGAYAVASGSLWVDGQRIYEAHGLAVRAVDRRP